MKSVYTIVYGYRDVYRAVGIRNRGETERAGGIRACVSDSWIRNNRRVAGDGRDNQGLDLVGRAGGDTGQIDCLLRGILIDRHVAYRIQGGRVVDRSDRDGDVGHIGVRSPVIGCVSKGVRAVEVEIGRVGERAVGIEGESAVCRAGDLDSGKRITVHIGIVGENARCSHIKHRVLIGAVGVVNSDRRIINPGH